MATSGEEMESVKSHCNRCQRETNQDILHSETVKWEDPSDDENYPPTCGTDIYQMLKCCGCDLISFKHVDWMQGRYDDKGNDVPEIYFYPPAIYRTEPKWIYDLDWFNDEQSFVRKLLKEIYNSLHNGGRRLATMGIRALIEHVMVKKAGDQGSFVKNIDKFAGQGLISISQKDILSAVLEAGHATIHRAYSPTIEDLHTCMDIAESIVEAIYIHPSKAEILKNNIPGRT